MAALIQNNTRTLVPSPPGKNIIGNRWVYNIKKYANGIIER